MKTILHTLISVFAVAIIATSSFMTAPAHGAPLSHPADHTQPVPQDAPPLDWNRAAKISEVDGTTRYLVREQSTIPLNTSLWEVWVHPDERRNSDATLCFKMRDCSRPPP